ncbi:hypothetical protein JIX56_09865 [Streptomyces sp. CA-210063]|uniref:hypothetical protein n=1 Tax=Streptomyces sp. CA-210063 TaxID=2801029 RepID=UPI00214C7837|nr:hypothetical protein [Streptomyces sp. CA-210063]UUU30170.1 hypothetical protein JIX56_09865 [Streptomyces sp. CA-210063]
MLTGLGNGTSGIDLDDTSVLGTLDPRIARPILEGIGSGIDTVFLILGGLGLLAVLVSLTIREKPKSQPSDGPNTDSQEQLAATE